MRTLIGFATVSILAAAVYFGCARPSDDVRRGTDGSPSVQRLVPRPATLAPGLHLLGGLEPAAAYVVETSQGLILIDSGIEPDAQSLRSQMTRLNLDRRKLLAILLTHAHADHSGGSQFLRAETGAKIYAGEADAAVLRDGGPHEALFGTFSLPEMKFVPTTVDVTLAGGESFELGNARFEAMSAPGHTPGSTCYFMEHRGLHVLFSGDVIQSLASKQKPDSAFARFGTYTAFLSPRYRGEAQAYLSTLLRLRHRPSPDLVLPGHPRNDPEPQDPAMTTERWEALLDSGIKDLKTLLARYESDGPSFLDDVPKTLLPDLYYLGDFNDVAVYAFVSASRLVLVNAPSGEGLWKFANERLRQLGLSQTPPSLVLLTTGYEKESGGITDLLAQGSCRAVATIAVRDALKHRLPSKAVLVSPNELVQEHWLDIESIYVGSCDIPWVDYLLHWHNKTVLISGRFPIKPNATAGKRITAEVTQLPATATAYAGALERLRRTRPDLWLPAYPVDGQNANLYGGEWLTILSRNEQLLR